MPAVTILVTGSEGRIGRVLVALLSSEGHTVRTFDQVEGAEIVGDLRDAPAVFAALEGVDAVAHLGAIPGPKAGEEEAVLASNTQGTWNVLLGCVRHGVRRAVNFSSVNAFGSFAHGNPLMHLPGGDDYPARHINVYMLGKHLAEEVGKYFAANHDMTVLCPRPVFVAVPDHYARWRERVAAGALPIPSGVNVDLWSYVDVRDVCEATRLALTLPDLRGFHAFLLSADDTVLPVPTAEIVDRELAHIVWRVDRDAYLGGDPYRSLVDCTKAKSLLGWRPRHSWRTVE
jgi:nucleoside-diphosphate-sugar epimerase